jgi:hypothetical protein
MQKRKTGPVMPFRKTFHRSARRADRTDDKRIRGTLGLDGMLTPGRRSFGEIWAQMLGTISQIPVVARNANQYECLGAWQPLLCMWCVFVQGENATISLFSFKTDQKCIQCFLRQMEASQYIQSLLLCFAVSWNEQSQLIFIQVTEDSIILVDDVISGCRKVCTPSLTTSSCS